LLARILRNATMLLLLLLLLLRQSLTLSFACHASFLITPMLHILLHRV
jgi:hypothetical protein